MFDEVLMTRDFDLALNQLQPQKREIVKRKIDYLRCDPSHVSLKAHRVKQAGEQIWECYIDQGMRLLYEMQQRTLTLWYLGGHALVDRARHLSFNREASLLLWTSSAAHEQSTAAPGLSGPAASSHAYRASAYYAQISASPTVDAQEPNCFAYFREAHLRLLGVPTDLVQTVLQAQTLDEVLALPTLPDEVTRSLLDLATSPTMQTVLLDSSQLLYRTRLDRLDGYFEGRIKKLMLNLEADQQQYVQLKRVPLLLLKGTAGCGKTTIGIYRAIRLAEEGRQVLVVTYNKTLADVTRTLIEELIGPLPRNLEVRTAHSVMHSLLGPRFQTPGKEQTGYARRLLREALAEVRLEDRAQVLQRDEGFFSDEIAGVIKGLGLGSVEAYKAIRRYGRKTALGPIQREAVWKVYLAYQRRLSKDNIHEWADAALLLLTQARDGSLGRTYDDIIVDEAQDLKPVDLRVLQLLVAREGGTLMVLGDAAQTLYSRGFPWVQAGISARGRTSILRINHRNTSQIAEAASQLIMKNTLMRSSNEYVDPLWTRRAGERPRLLTATSSHEQIDLVYQQVLELLANHRCRLADVAVLCLDNSSCRRGVAILNGYGLRAVLRDDPAFNILEEQMKVLTIHSAKGLEFPVVFLTSLVEGDFPRPPVSGHDEEEVQLEIERARMLCYVGMTRAAEMLYLVTVRGQESRFVYELTDKIDG
jgi:superfamily I DNA/RNA helicase/mRNA-degrading endonuclease YafQ of YafQ-DinJ toxin-antitoxin module